jgi:uncharacterized protein (TIGR03435 family)
MQAARALAPVPRGKNNNMQTGAALIAITAFGLFEQGQTQPMAFEVTSVRAHNGPLSRLFQFSSSGYRMTLEGYTAMELVQEAYNLKGYQVSAGRSAQRSDDTYYDVVANAPAERLPSRADFRLMLQTLLADRFGLQVHREMKEMQVYALVVGKGGPRLKESAPDANIVGNHGVHGRNQTITASKYSMEMLADDLVGFYAVDRPVVDETELTGAYDFKFEATPEFRINADAEFGDISVFTAVQEQLGLKLESQKAPIEILVVDRLNKPTPN